MTKDIKKLEKVRKAFQKKTKEYNDVEFRVEVAGIGNGHYFRRIELAVDEAKELSKRFNNDTIVLELYKPVRKVLSKFVNGRDIKTGVL